MICFAKYFIANLKITENQPEEALRLINDSLAMLQKYNNSSKILYALLEKLYISIARENNLTSVDTDAEEQKLQPFKTSLSRILD